MQNPIWKLYEKLDNTIMYGVNKGVKALNWTTGKTKTSLANSLLTVAPIFECSGAFVQDPIIGGLYVLIFIPLSNTYQKMNKRIEIREKEAAERNSKLDPFTYREHASMGPGGILMAGFAPLDEFHGTVTRIGLGVRGASHYVMRADYLPPRKNVLSRAKDKLAEKLKDINLNPAPQPAFAPVRYKNNLEDYI